MILIHINNLRQTVVLEMYCRNADCFYYRLHTPHLPSPGRDCDKEYYGIYPQCCRMGHDKTKSTYVYNIYISRRWQHINEPAHERDSIKCMIKQNMSNLVSHERGLS